MLNVEQYQTKISSFVEDLTKQFRRDVADVVARSLMDESVRADIARIESQIANTVAKIDETDKSTSKAPKAKAAPKGSKKKAGPRPNVTPEDVLTQIRDHGPLGAAMGDLVNALGVPASVITNRLAKLPQGTIFRTGNKRTTRYFLSAPEATTNGLAS